MADQKETYKGREIIVREGQGFPELSIDSKLVPFSRSSDHKTFSSKFTPFLSFRSLMDLAKKLIDEELD